MFAFSWIQEAYCIFVLLQIKLSESNSKCEQKSAIWASFFLVLRLETYKRVASKREKMLDVTVSPFSIISKLGALVVISFCRAQVFIFGNSWEDKLDKLSAYKFGGNYGLSMAHE